MYENPIRKLKGIKYCKAWIYKGISEWREWRSRKKTIKQKRIIEIIFSFQWKKCLKNTSV